MMTASTTPSLASLRTHLLAQHHQRRARRAGVTRFLAGVRHRGCSRPEHLVTPLTPPRADPSTFFQRPNVRQRSQSVDESPSTRTGPQPLRLGGRGAEAGDAAVPASSEASLPRMQRIAAGPEGGRMPRGLVCVVVAVLVAVALLGTGGGEPASRERTHVAHNAHEASPSDAVDSQPRLAAAGGLADAGSTHVATSPKAIARRRNRTRAEEEGAEGQGAGKGSPVPAQTEEQRRAGADAFGVQDSAPKRARLRGAPSQDSAGDGSGGGGGGNDGSGLLGATGLEGLPPPVPPPPPPPPPGNQTESAPPARAAARNQTAEQPPARAQSPRRRPSRGKRAGKRKRNSSPLGQ